MQKHKEQQKIRHEANRANKLVNCMGIWMSFITYTREGMGLCILFSKSAENEAEAPRVLYGRYQIMVFVILWKGISLNTS